MAGGLTIDPGTVVKLYGTRIEAGFGARFTAEGTAANPIVFTSLEDDTYGAGGTFDTTNDGQRQTAAPGDWGGIYFDATSQGSLDYARVYYAGGNVAIEGGFATFAPIDIRQATVRIADSLFQYNTCSTTTDDRNGRGDIEQAAVIYVRFAQPVIVNNVIRDNQNAAATDDADEVAAISVDVNSLNSLNVPDWGRSTGFSDAYSQYDDNYGPLVRGNALTNNDLNGMVVRGGTLTTEGIWDDTDIAHIVFDRDRRAELRHLRRPAPPEQQHRQPGRQAHAARTPASRPPAVPWRSRTASAGRSRCSASPGHPVVLTEPGGRHRQRRVRSQTATPCSTPTTIPTSVATPGDWAGITLDEYSNDRNVAVINETEPAIGATTDANGTPNTAQPLGELAQNENSGDDTLRLGFEVHGAIAMDRPQDADVYSFQGYAGTEVWITLDRTTFSLDTVVELIDADGNVLARSDDWRDEDADPNLLTAYFAGNIALPMTSDAWGYNDVYSINPSDAALRLVLPGPAGQQRTYYVRVYSALDIGDIDAAHVPDKTVLNGETFQISDATNTTATFEFINLGAATPTTPAGGDTAIYYNTTTSHEHRRNPKGHRQHHRRLLGTYQYRRHPRAESGRAQRRDVPDHRSRRHDDLPVRRSEGRRQAGDGGQCGRLLQFHHRYDRHAPHGHRQGDQRQPHHDRRHRRHPRAASRRPGRNDVPDHLRKRPDGHLRVRQHGGRHEGGGGRHGHPLLL